MKTLRYLFLALAVALLSGCYEDKGNYEYMESTEPGVDMEWNYYAVIGQPLDIEPQYEFMAGRSENDYTFEWYVLETKVGEGAKLHIDSYSGAIGTKKSYLRITDKASGMIYLQQFYLGITTEFQRGYVILCDKGGKTELNFLRMQYATNDDKAVTSVDMKLYSDLTADLPSEPVAVIEHHAGRTELGEIAVLGKNGGVELDGNSFSKVIDTESEFMNKKLPAELTQIDGAIYLRFNSYIFGNGNLYARYNNTPDGYHTGSYMDIAVYPPNGGVDPGFAVSSVNIMSYQGLIYDKANHRYLLLADQSATYAGTIATLGTYSNSAVPKDGTFDISNMGSDVNVICCGCYKNGYGRGYYYGILRDGSGKTYIHDFATYNSYGRVSVTALTQSEVSWGGLIGDDAKIVTPFSEGDKAFISTGDKIYVNFLGTSTPSLFASFNGVKVTSMAYDDFEYSWYTYGNRQLAVGLEDGRFLVYDISNAAIASVVNGGAPTVLFSADNLGKVVSVCFKRGQRRDY